MNKKTLALLFSIICSQQVLAELPAEFKNINLSQLGPEKEVLIAEKIREIKALEKELTHYGSESPAITNTRLGLIGMTGGAATLIAGALLNNKELTNVGLTILVGGGVITAGSGISNNDGQIRILHSHQEARKELEQLISKKV